MQLDPAAADADGEPVDLLAEFRAASDRGLIDRPISIGRKGGEPLTTPRVSFGLTRAPDLRAFHQIRGDKNPVVPL
jgi:hypothetical protein